MASPTDPNGLQDSEADKYVWLGPQPKQTGNLLFFYGTLMHPDILQRVIQREGNQLEICSALLFNHTRHQVRGADYPGVVPSSVSEEVMSRTLTDEERCVRGVIVRGFTYSDIGYMDMFEGDEYIRVSAAAHPTSTFQLLSEAPAEKLLCASKALPTAAELTPPVDLDVYLWAGGAPRLTASIWSFDVFVKEKLHKWIGPGGQDNPDYLEVDKRRDMKGTIVSVVPEGGEGCEPIALVDQDPEDDPALGQKEFGHNMKKQFKFSETYVNLNNGSYGATPVPVLQYVQTMSELCEERPDKFMRFTYLPFLNQARERVAKLIGAETDECVIVPNTTHGINTILRNMEWEDGDVIVGFSTSYDAISKTLQYISDISPNPTLSTMQLTFPISDAEVLKQFREHLQNLPNDFDQKVVVVMDGIVSNPGVRLPWEEMVKICREEKVWSVVDAAHCIGQIPVNLRESQPDFWVSNCHKWLMSKRGSAVLYVPKRNQHIIKSSFPTSHAYVSSRANSQAPHDMAHLFEWTGTSDLAPFLSINAALDFRASIGGEKTIQDYCNDLAKRGGERMREILGTGIIETNPERPIHMVNVRLPLPVPSASEERTKIYNALSHFMLQEYDCYAAIFLHDKKWWARASAQIWNEVSDFEYVAKALKGLCGKIEREGTESIVLN